MNIQNERNRAIIEEFRTNGGKVGGPFAGRTLLLLHTMGAKSGQSRINPVAYIHDGERLVTIASKGAPRPIPAGTTTSLLIHSSQWKSAPKSFKPGS